MDHFAGLDVSVEETSVCIVDDAGTLLRLVAIEFGLEVAAAELHAARLGGLQRQCSALANHAALALGESGEQVQPGTDPCRHRVRW